MDGIVRAIDRMGRVVIPKEYRDQLKVENEKDSFEIFLRDGEMFSKNISQPVCFAEALDQARNLEAIQCVKNALKDLPK